MGLFGRKKTESAKEPEIRDEYKNIRVNITDKMLRVELAEDDAYVKFCRIEDDGNHIRIVSSGILIAEVGKRGKAYQELKPYVGMNVEGVAIYPNTGEYGSYYSLKMKIRIGTIVTIGD